MMCSCFQVRKKDAGQSVLSKEPISMDAVPSSGMNAAFEKFPGSPLNVPPSPFRVPPSPSRFSLSSKVDGLGSVDLNVKQLVKATKSFSSSMLIGSGGFGDVYKAELPDGRIVAIKRAKKEFFQALQAEFKSEIELLAKIEHRNLVKLLGFIDKGDERLIITEYVPNGNLREYLDGLKPKILNFSQRLEIAIDIAHGITYLHSYAEMPIIHRDIKSSNVLVTDDMRAKVADFGFARLGDESAIHTRVKGTFGYLDPEYIETNMLTSKSDVYSFGILLLEILTGRRPIDTNQSSQDRLTIKWAFKNYKKGRIVEMLDPQMNQSVDEEILVKMFGLVIRCATTQHSKRPDMKTVAEQLWLIRIDYLRGNKG